MSVVAPAPVVVGFDGSDSSAVAVQVARAEAAGHGVPLVVVHGWLVTDPGVPLDQPVRLDDETRQRLAQTVHDLVAPLLAGTAQGEVDQRVQYGYAGRVLVDASTDASLVVVGSRGLGALHGALLGSVSQYVLEHASSPVLVAHGTTAIGPRRVVVGIDGSPSSLAALRWADAEANRRGVELVAVHATSAVRSLLDREVPGDGGDDADKRLSAWVQDALGEQRAGAVTCVTDARPAARLLLDLVDEDDLLVVGRSGTGGILRLGSVARRLAAHAPGALVVVPGER